MSSVAHAAWPLDGQIDLSSGFGDYRSGRYHAGLDLRTGGVPGKPVKAPVDGYISRIRIAYTGYGKGLYMTGTDGYTYVFGHLQGFNPALEKVVKSRQLKFRRYFVDFELPADSFRVTKGELIAYSGQTGAGAPHLHFEKRTADNRPLNPITHGFELKDNVRPIFERIGFQQTDDHSLFSNASRKLLLPVRGTGKAGMYKLDTVLYLNAPFGLLVDCYDRMRKEGMNQSVYKLQAFVDQQLYFQVTMDSIDYDQSSSATVMYDFSEALDGESKVKRLYRRTGNDFSGLQAPGPGQGVVGLGDSLSYGPHHLEIVAEDALGNRSQLNATFVWGPPEDLYALDSTIAIDDTTNDYYFTPHADYAKLDVTSTKVFVNRADRWYEYSRPVLDLSASGHLKIRVAVGGLSRAVLRLQYVTRDKAQVADFPFNGFALRGIRPPAIAYTLTDDGMIIRGELTGRVAYHAQVELFNGDSLLAIEPLRQFNSMSLYAFFIPPRPEYRRITRLQMRFQSELDVEPRALDSLDIVVAGFDDTTTLTVDQYMEFVVAKDDLYNPCYIDLKKATIMKRETLGLVSDDYQLGPVDLLLKRPIAVRATALPSPTRPKQHGICRLDKSSDKWIWLGTTMTGANRLTASTTRGGSHAILADTEPPKFSGLNVPEYRPVFDPMHEITFTLKDNLSGFENDQSIVIKLDGEWLIPEYDPETGICKTAPNKPMAVGNHTLSLEFTDRADNKTQKRVTFEVAASKAAKKKGK